MVSNIFASSPKSLLRRCGQKYAVIRPILQGLRIKSPKDFYALLMPCLNGPELEILRGSAGVPGDNIWAIEGDKATFVKMKKSLDIRMLDRPMPSDKAMIFIEAEMTAFGKKFDLIYLDYWSKPHYEHVKVLKYIFGQKMINRGGTLILNFGNNRSAHYAARIDRKISESVVPTKEYVDQVLAMLKKMGLSPLEYATFEERPYASKPADGVREHDYLTSVFRF